MNKLFPLLAFAAFALVACSEDKPEPSQSEICAKKPITRECLIGNWYLDKMEGGRSNCTPSADKPNMLNLMANGQFSFIGNYDNVEIDTKGTWELNEAGMRINCIVGTCDLGIDYPVDAAIETRTGGRLELRITTDNYTAFLQCNQNLSEVFVWRGK